MQLILDCDLLQTQDLGCTPGATGLRKISLDLEG